MNFVLFTRNQRCTADLETLQNIPRSAAAKSELKWNIWLELMELTAIGDVYSKCGEVMTT